MKTYELSIQPTRACDNQNTHTHKTHTHTHTQKKKTNQQNTNIAVPKKRTEVIMSHWSIAILKFS